jgi:hypothetical protein
MFDHDNPRRCIRILGTTPDRDYFLAVPSIPRAIPRARRVEILEYVLRRQYTYAVMLCESIPDPDGYRDRLARMVAEEPHHTPHAHAA